MHAANISMWRESALGRQAYQHHLRTGAGWAQLLSSMLSVVGPTWMRTASDGEKSFNWQTLLMKYEMTELQQATKVLPHSMPKRHGCKKLAGNSRFEE